MKKTKRPEIKKAKPVSKVLLGGACLLLLASGFYFIVSFKPSKYTTQELAGYIMDEENGFFMTKTLQDLEYEVAFMPACEMALREMSSEPQTPENYARHVKEQEGSLCFRLKINTHGGIHPVKYNVTEKDEAYMRKKYIDFDMNKDVYLLQGNDTIDCSLHHHYMNDIDPTMQVMFLFDESKLKKDKPVVFCMDDKIFGNSVLMFEFNNEVISFNPEIVF
ncbi:MAG TPA: hypothetical protein VD905_07855 [Flavobacteriales bacterium]|nr:hypothetical protein [Flavobacteriales bacterium]